MRNYSALFALPLVVAACGGPNYHFDPAPTPDWTRAETKAGGPTLLSVGAAPTTLEPQRDLDLATADAKNRIAQIFDSHVASRASDWSIAINSKAGQSERQVSQQSTEVRSNVRIEDVAVKQVYRDEASKNQYVQVEVDRTAWLRKLHDRVDREFAALSGHADAAEAAMGQKHFLGSFKEYLAGQAAGYAIEADIIVMDLLDPSAGAFDKLTSIRKNLGNLHAQLVTNFGFTLQVGSAPVEATAQLRSGLEDFFKAQGFATTANAGAARIVVNVSEQFVQVAQVANRQEQVHAALGDLKVYEPDGREVPELAVSLGSSQTESDVDAAKARSKALNLAVDSIVSKFRSVFRKNFQP